MMFFSVAEFGSLVVGLQLCHPFGVGFGSLVHYSSTIMSPLRGWVGSLVHSLFVYNYVTPSGLGWLIRSFIIRLKLYHPFGVGLVYWFIIRLQLCHPFGVGLGSLDHYSSTIMSPLRGFGGSLVHYLSTIMSPLRGFGGSLVHYLSTI